MMGLVSRTVLIVGPSLLTHLPVGLLLLQVRVLSLLAMQKLGLSTVLCLNFPNVLFLWWALVSRLAVHGLLLKPLVLLGVHWSHQLRWWDVSGVWSFAVTLLVWGIYGFLLRGEGIVRQGIICHFGLLRSIWKAHRRLLDGHLSELAGIELNPIIIVVSTLHPTLHPTFSTTVLHLSLTELLEWIIHAHIRPFRALSRLHRHLDRRLQNTSLLDRAEGIVLQRIICHFGLLRSIWKAHRRLLDRHLFTVLGLWDVLLSLNLRWLFSLHGTKKGSKMEKFVKIKYC